MIRIDTMEDFLRVREGLKPVTITSKTHGPIEVPCCNTLLVRTTLIVANAYNPNTVPEEKMELLRESILQNGFCFPVVAIWDEDRGLFVVIDGFHRTTIGGATWLDFDYIPVVVLAHDITKRMIATHQFNKARGVHQVDLDADIVRSLIEQGVSEEDISTKLGLDLDSVHRYKQLTGIADLFKSAQYSMSWEMVESP